MLTNLSIPWFVFSQPRINNWIPAKKPRISKPTRVEILAKEETGISKMKILFRVYGELVSGRNRRKMLAESRVLLLNRIGSYGHLLLSRCGCELGELEFREWKDIGGANVERWTAYLLHFLLARTLTKPLGILVGVSGKFFQDSPTRLFPVKAQI